MEAFIIPTLRRVMARQKEDVVNKTNDGYLSKSRFVKVSFSVLHQHLVCELPPAEITASFNVEKVELKTVSPCLEDRDC